MLTECTDPLGAADLTCRTISVVVASSPPQSLLASHHLRMRGIWCAQLFLASVCANVI